MLNTKVVGWAVVLCAGATASAAPRYTVTRIDPGPGNTEARPAAINDSGLITGHIDKGPPGSDNGPNVPFVWNGSGPLRELPATGFGVAVNNRGEVLGGSGAFGGGGVFVWSEAGGMRPIAPPAGRELTGPRDINDDGTVVVEFFDPATTSINGTARRRADGTFEEVQGFRPSFRTEVINASGAVVGSGAVWGADGVVRALSTPPGGQGHNGLAINDAGLVAGTYSIEHEGSFRSAMAVWRPDGSVIAVPLMPGVDVASQEPLGINNLGQVVGYTNLTNHDNDAFYWSEAEGSIDLQTLLDPSAAGWDLQWATDINEAGQIIGVATFQDGGFQGVLLTPVPEPAAPLVAAFLCLFLTARRGRRAR
jgi:probable HAF family extracellular repeat protein